MIWTLLVLPWLIAVHMNTARPTHPVIVVGVDTLSREAMVSRLARDRCMHDTTATLSGSLAELVAAQLEYAVLKHAFHEEPPDSSIQMTAARLPGVTHDSAALACIMALGDSMFFLHDYVRPTLVNPRLYGRFYSDTNIHRAARDSILRIFQRLAPHPELFLTYQLDTIIIKRTEQPGAISHPSVPVEESPLVRNILSKLGSRKLWPQIVESDLDFSIVMLDTVTDSIYRAMTIRVVKQPFDPWFRMYVEHFIPIHFLDRGVEGNLRKQYPQLWWLHRRAQ